MRSINETEVAKRRIELLKKYYPVDEINKIITFKLYYDHASDLLDYNVGEESCEMFKEEFLTKLHSIFEKIPVGYKADVVLEIKDYDVYDPKSIMERFNDLIELNSYNVVRRSKKNQVLSAILVLVGITILVINRILGENGIYGAKESLESSILLEFFDITSWVFIWQAVTVLFLSPSNRALEILAIAKCLNTFGLSDKGNMAISLNRNEILNKCRMDSKVTKAKNNSLLVFSTALAFFGLIFLVNPLEPLSWNNPNGYVYLGNILQIIIGVIVILIGVYGLTRFGNHPSKLNPMYLIALISFLIIFVLWFISLFFISSTSIQNIVTLGIILAFFLGYLVTW